jgi:uncharacterized protein YbjT (DUF2867 family)
MRIVVNTPTGNIGRPLVEALLARGAEVTLIARSPDKVRDFEARGARVVQGSIDDAAVLERALEGAGALFWLSPPAFRPDWSDWALGAAKQAAEAVRRRDVKRVVVLSSVGAQSGRGTGPVGVLLEVEDAFRAVAPDVVALRAAFFMENDLRSLDTVVKAGAIFSPVPADLAAPIVATKDIAAVAAEELTSAARGHRVRGVHGPADLTGEERAAILSELLHAPIRYVQVPVEAAEQGMRDAGLPDFAVAMYGDMYRAILDGRMSSSEPRSPETTTPTTYADFAASVLRPAILPQLPQFFVRFRRKADADVEAMKKMLPAERDHYLGFVKAGLIPHGFFSADGTQAFVILRSPSLEAATGTMGKFPLAPFVDIEIVPLAPPPAG